jgi:predicted DNA-binding protein YlxM (UPF0122 family)
MAILENEIMTPINNRNIAHYEDLGYIVRFTESNGNIVVMSDILVSVADLPIGSGIKLTKICDHCGIHIPEVEYGTILRVRLKTNMDLCRKCGVKFSKEKMIPSYDESLEFFAMQNGLEIILDEFSEKNSHRPNQIYKASNKKFIWNCNKCKHEYYSTAPNRIKSNGCPNCNPYRKYALRGVDDLWTTHPHIAENLMNPERGYELKSKSNKKEDFKCPDCGIVIRNKSIDNILRRGLNCVRCGDNQKYPEKFFSSILEQLNIKYQTQKTFKWSKKRRFDFYIPSVNSLIEVNGRQHYEHTGFYRSLEEEIKNDILKRKLALENSIDNYIIIDCKESNMNYIRDSIKSSKLAELFSLEKIDWNLANELATTSIVKIVSDLWAKKKLSIAEISNEINLNRNSVARYLKRGNELGWCTYERTFSKEVIQLTLDGRFIREFTSTLEASIHLNIQQPSISRVCNRKMKSTGGYRWMFKEDYEQFRNNHQ